MQVVRDFDPSNFLFSLIFLGLPSMSTNGHSLWNLLYWQAMYGCYHGITNMRNRDPHRENVVNILAISLPIVTMQHIREPPSASHAMRKSAWNDYWMRSIPTGVIFCIKYQGRYPIVLFSYCGIFSFVVDLNFRGICHEDVINLIRSRILWSSQK